MADSFNELMGLGSHSADAALAGWWPLQDDAATTAVADQSSGGNDGTLNGGDNTDDISTTGPNSWLTKALQLNGTDDFISLGDLEAMEFGTDDEFSYGAWVNPSGADETGHIIGKASSADGNLGTSLYWDGTNDQIAQTAGTSAVSGARSSTVFTDTDWVLAGTSSSGGTATFFRNGVAAGSDTYGSSVAANTTADARIGNRASVAISATLFGGGIAAPFAFGRPLSAGEWAQINAGPEPVNSVAPVLSGTESVGSTLSVTTGTWGLPSPFASGTNGTITYAYQWTRSDDSSGTNEADISGATSSTYTLQGADAGKYIRCRVAASNDGGRDSAADTATPFTDAVSGQATPSGRARLMKGVG